MANPTTGLSWAILKARNDAEYARKFDARRKKWWAEHKEKHRRIVRDWYYQLSGEAKKERAKRLNALDSHYVAGQKHVWKRRLAAMESLGGPRCVRCGYDTDFRALVVDHINGGGQIEYRKYNYNVLKMLKDILALPETERVAKYQVLCANCNRIKQFENGEFGRGVAFYKNRKEN